MSEPVAPFLTLSVTYDVEGNYEFSFQKDAERFAEYGIRLVYYQLPEGPESEFIRFMNNLQEVGPSRILWNDTSRSNADWMLFTLIDTSHRSGRRTYSRTEWKSFSSGAMDLVLKELGNKW